MRAVEYFNQMRRLIYGEYNKQIAESTPAPLGPPQPDDKVSASAS
jgi:hypothetical protein